MAAHTWQLDRDIHLARYQGDTALAVALEYELGQVRAVCSHVPNPEAQDKHCYKCGASYQAQAGPGLVKATGPALETQRRQA